MIPTDDKKAQQTRLLSKIRANGQNLGLKCPCSCGADGVGFISTTEAWKTVPRYSARFWELKHEEGWQ